MDKIKGLTSNNSGKLKQLQVEIESAKLEGRSADWFRRRKRELVNRTKKDIKKQQAERGVHLLREKAAIREMVKKPDDFTQRQYHMNRAAALLQGLSDEQMYKVFDDIMSNDREARQFKHEYESYVRARSSDPMEFDQVRRKHLTFEERTQEREMAGVEILEKDVEMIKGFEDMALTELLETGTTDIDTNEYFEMALRGMENAKDKAVGIKPEPDAEQQRAISEAKEQGMEENKKY